MKKQIKDRLMMLTKVLLTEDEKNGDYSEIDDLLNGINLDDFKKMITEHFNNFQNTRRRVKKIETDNINYDVCYKEFIKNLSEVLLKAKKKQS